MVSIARLKQHEIFLADYRLRHFVNNVAMYFYTRDYIRMEITVLYLKISCHQLSIYWCNFHDTNSMVEIARDIFRIVANNAYVILSIMWQYTSIYISPNLNLRGRIPLMARLLDPTLRDKVSQ